MNILTILEQTNKWCLRYPNGKFVALDSASGGYPYEVDSALSAHDFRTLGAATKYIAKDEHFKPVMITITASVVNAE